MDMPFRVRHGEFARYRCKEGLYFRNNPHARPEVKLMCKHDLGAEQWKYYYFEDDTVEFDPETHQWETCAPGNIGVLDKPTCTNPGTKSRVPDIEITRPFNCCWYFMSFFSVLNVLVLPCKIPEANRVVPNSGSIRRDYKECKYRYIYIYRVRHNNRAGVQISCKKEVYKAATAVRQN